MTTANEHQDAIEPVTLSEEWYASYQRELFDESGDADALLTSYHEEAEMSLPDSTARRALALLLERIREEDADLELVDSDEA